MQAKYLSTDANLMEIVVGSIEITPYARVPAPFLLETGVIVKMSRYNLEGVVLALLYDYGIEKVMEVINSMRSDNEPIYVPEKTN